MKLHTDTVTVSHVYAAAEHASQVSGGTVTVTRARIVGSRSRAFGIDVALEGDGTLGRKRNASNTGIAATWSQWGHFLAAVYAQDPAGKFGPYADADDFHTRTNDAYRF